MSREIRLYVLDPKYNDPMALIRTSRRQWETGSTYSRSYPLNWDPPPDTLFMRATNVDLGVFGEELADGSLQMIDANHTQPCLERALEADIDETVAALVAFAADSVPPVEVSDALRTGTWTQFATKERGAILQAAGFARCLLMAIHAAAPAKRAVVWEYTGGRPTYKYP